jgi:DinB superfamily
MRALIPLFVLSFFFSCTDTNDKLSVKKILLEQLRNSHTDKDWYVPLNFAVQGLTSEQANWKDSTDNHSICQLVSHLTFWNERILIAFQGNTPPDFNDNNDETFLSYCNTDWEATVSKLDSIQTAWEKAVENASEKQLEEWSSSVANISSHNAYHTGQIIYIRKKNNWWKNSMGVK